jgi:hypothetical protein
VPSYYILNFKKVFTPLLFFFIHNFTWENLKKLM